MSISSLQVLFFFGVLFINKNISAFQCNNSKIISDDLFCNKFNDCSDLSDEKYGCSKPCGPGKFRCIQNKACINIKNRCNAVNDCSDGSDEKFCGNQSVIINPNDCSLDQGKFLCKNKLACIDFSKTCDGRYDCIDNSDENYTNCSKLDSASCSSCIQSCLPTPDGPRCFCNSFNRESSPVCKEIKSCNGCSQHCTRYRNFMRCLCYEGFHEVPGTNGTECQNNYWLETVLLYSSVSKIKLFNYSFSDTIELVQNDVRCTALTASSDNVYYAEFRNNSASIRRSFITGRGIAQEIVKLDSRITSIYVDWVTENVYFISNKSLYVCDRNGQICTQLKCCGINDVVLVSKYGIMFYTQYVITGEDEQFIMKSNMDGSDEDYVVPDESFQLLASIAFDQDKDNLYWIGRAENTLNSIALNGTKKYVNKYVKSLTISYFSVLGEKVFLAKQRDNIVYPAQIRTNEDLRLMSPYVDNSTSYIKHLYVHSPRLQRTHQVANVCAEAPCNGLCLTRSSSNGLNYTCLCENFAPTENNQWCDKYKKYSSEQSTSVAPNSSIITKTTPSASNEPNSESTDTADYFSTTTEQLVSSEATEVDVWPAEVSSTVLPHYINFTEEGSTSLSKEYDYAVIYSTATEIKAWYVVNDTHRVIQSGVQSTALAGVRGYIYYGSIDKHGHIFKIDIESGQTEELVRMDTPITSISVDWITNNIYFTSNMSLSVCSSDGSICTKLKCCGQDQVAVTSRSQLMFYTQKMISSDVYLIMRADLDGSADYRLSFNGFRQIFSLTVDESNEKVYWLVTETGPYMLYSASFTGNPEPDKEPIHFTSSKYLYFAMLEGNLFHELGDQNIVWENRSRIYKDEDTNSIKFLHAFSPALQNADKITNPCHQSPCSGLCLLSPTSSTNNASFTCICENFTPNDENRWCDKDYPTAELQFSTPKTNLTEKQEPRLENSSLVSVVTIRRGHFMASHATRFILGVMSCCIVMGVYFIYQKFNFKRIQKEFLLRRHCEEMEL